LEEYIGGNAFRAPALDDADLEPLWDTLRVITTKEDD